MIQTVEADCELDFSELNLSLAKSIQLLEPYGVSNPIPVFIMRGVTVAEISGISDGKHTRLALGNGRYNISAMYFSNSPESLGVYVGDKVDVLFNLDINEWGGRENVQLIVRDLKPSRQEAEEIFALRERFEEIKNGAPFTKEENILPSREDFAAVYRFMLATLRAGSDTLSHKKILAKFRGGDEGVNIGYIKLKVIVMVMKELNIANIEDASDEVYRFNIQYKTTKTELDKSTLLRRLRSQMIR